MSQQYFQQAELALAAYANLEPDVNIRDELRTAGLSATQTDKFISQYTVVDQHGDATGLSATVFLNNNTGETILATRGTEITDPADLLTGLINIILFGSTTLQPQYLSLKGQVQTWLNNDILPPTFTVTGHSLGGFLATDLTVDAQFSSNITHAYLYNTPGQGGIFGDLLKMMQDTWGFGTQYDPSKFSNIEAVVSDGLNNKLITGLGYDVSPPINIMVEDQTGGVASPEGARNHSIKVLTDALAVQSVYSQIAPNLTQDQLNILISASGGVNTESIDGINNNMLESALDAIRFIASGPSTVRTTADNSDSFYTNLIALPDVQKFKDLVATADTNQLILLAGMSAGDIITMAAANSAQGLATRYALTALNPFVLEGADYAYFSANNALDRFHPESGTGNITDRYLIDRASLLESKLWFNTQNKKPFNPNSDEPTFENGTRYFEDAASGYKIQQGGLFDNTHRYYFGDKEANNPTASGVKDYLYGGGGNDTLQGLKGNDYLEGGVGTDTYIINPDDGIDTVLDTDGDGVIKFGDNLIAEGSGGVIDGKDWVKIGNGWVDQQNGLRYLLIDQGNNINDLLIESENGDGVEIQAWKDGQLGITLAENTPPVEPIYTTTIMGDDDPEDLEDVLFGTPGNDLIQSLDENDRVDAEEGDDRVEGGSGQDLLGGGLDSDVVLGGTDSDTVLGQEGTDRLYAETEYTIDEAYTLGETQIGTGERGDFLDGGPDDDIAIGEAGNDILMGGMGKDIIMGLGGDDTIEGDKDATSIGIDWTVTRTTSTENDVTSISREYSFLTTDISADTGDNDVIYGGAGNDWIFAQGGNDFVDAGVDNDFVFGEGGNDIILGGDGNDSLVGDTRPSLLNASLHGDDYIVGGSGIDLIWGEGGSDYLEGGSGADELYGDTIDIPVEFQGDDVLDGGEDNDKLFGLYGDDTLIGGTGFDELYGGPGNDTYIGVEMGDIVGDVEGKSTIILADTNVAAATSANEPNGISATSFAEPAAVPTNAPSSVTWLVDSSSLQITLEDGTSIDLQGALYGMDAQIYYDHGSQGIDLESWVSTNLLESVTLSLNFDWEAAGLEQPATFVYSGAGADFLFGSVNNDTIKGYGGNDQLVGDAGDDLVMGGVGDDILDGGDGADTLQGDEGNDFLQSGAGDDFLLGGAGNDELQGNQGNDALEGDGGDDNLFGQEGSDTLHGGAGNDVLSGNSENDVYLFNLGDGQDVIWEEGDSAGDVLRFGEGILPADITVAKSNYDLVLFHANGLDQVTISNWYAGSSSQLAQFEFSDGTVWNGSDLGALGGQYLRGTAGNDIISGTTLDETLAGLDGDDQLYGNDGDDTLIGSKGNDYLNGGLGANTYLFALGDGADTIDVHFPDMLRFAVDISSADIIVERMENNLVLHHQNGVDSVTIANWYSATNDKLQKVVFDADGTIWTTSTLQEMGLTFGNQYTLDLGDGAKIIEDWGGVDALTFGVNIDDADVTISRIGQNLNFTHVNGTDSVTIKDWFNDLAKQVEDIRFSTTGAILTTAQLTTPFLTLTGTAGDDVIQGGDAYAETLIGLGGNDTLNGGKLVGTYIFNLGDGQDTITDTSFGFGGNTLIFGSGLLDLLSISFEPNLDTVYSFGTDSVRVTAGSNITPKFIANGTAAADAINGSDFGDVIHGLEGDDVINGNAGADELYGDVGNDTLIGGDGSDWLYGGDGDDVLDGSRLTGIDDIETFFSDSRDYYVGGKGDDTLHGNSNADEYYFNIGDGHDTIIEGSYFANGQWFFSSSDKLIFGPGITPESIQVSRLNDDLLVTVSATDTVTTQSWFNDFKSQIEFFKFDDGSVLSATDITRLLNTQHGTDGDDVLVGDSTADNVLFGEAGNDTLTGGNGNDALYGGTGNDTLNGRGGNDKYYFVRGDGQDIINEIGGSDTVFFDDSISASYFVLSRNANNLVLTLAGTSDSITIENYMNGNLSLSINSASNVLNYANFNLIESYVFPDGSSLPSINSIRDSFLNIRGTTADDALDGTAWADVIYGDAGNDMLHGLEDDDVLHGGAGNDYLDGGSGRTNLLYGEGGDDILIGGTENGNYLLGGDGNDTYRLTSQATFNVLESGGIDDKIEFYAGIGLTALNFSQWGGDHLGISIAGVGSFNLYNHFLNDNFKVDSLLFADGTTLGLRDIQIGSASINTLIGTAEDSILIGGADKGTLDGGDGNDWIDGGFGGNTMIGGAGDDLFFVNHRKDIATELANQGIDTVSSSITYALKPNVENLILTGTSKLKGTGNELDNMITGNSAANTLIGNDGNDTLDGKGGIDKMQGGAGDDIYVVDVPDDLITERSNKGTDLVLSSVTYTAPKHVENLTLTGMAGINGRGNTLDNVLTGNSASNILTGDKGNDTYVMGLNYGADTVVENDSTAGNTDIVQFLTSINVDQIWFQHVGNNLEASIIGTTDKLVVNDWYLGSANHIEQFKTADGLTLLDSQVEGLVFAMAGFAPPDLGQTTLPVDYAAALNSVIAASWL